MFLCFKLYSLNFVIKIVLLTEIYYTLVALKMLLNQYFLSNLSPFDKQIRNIKYFEMFDLSRFLTSFLCQISYYISPTISRLALSQTKILKHIHFPMEISVIKFQIWQFDENPTFQN